ncbi:unnamed protein product [Rotaria sp. Silwood2]|nr:unnamed protein product [Rotaria sp. Silwood2]CAF4535160.1 unnamed protein product [Rotaria sp. Silwood2]
MVTPVKQSTYMNTRSSNSQQYEILPLTLINPKYVPNRSSSSIRRNEKQNTSSSYASRQCYQYYAFEYIPTY